MESFLLSVCIITYNHSQFISKAIESVLNQRTRHKFKIYIADDFSTDGTREILINYKKKYPEIIELILQTSNVGPAQNWIDLLSRPTSEYIAYFEGDDYWVDDSKIELQLNYLIENPKCGLVYSKSAIEINGEILTRLVGECSLKRSLFETNVIPTLTVMFKSKLFHDFVFNFKKEIHEWKIGDYPLWLWIYTISEIKFLDKITTVHRVVRGSESNKGNRLLINHEAFRISNFFLEKSNKRESYSVYFRRRFFLLLACLKNDPKSFFKLLSEIL